MSIFTRLFKKKKEEIKSAGAEQELMDCCERLMEKTNLLKQEKREYDTDTSYLNDTEILDGLKEEDRREIAETANSIVKLSDTRKLYMNWESKVISEERLKEFDRVRDQLPDTILRLKSNESYQAMVRRDLNKLEEERNLWGYERKAIKKREKTLRTGLTVLASLFILCVVAMAVVTMTLKMDMTIPLCIAGIAVVLLAFLMYFKMQLDEKALKQAEVNLNHSIELLNRMKTKYVSVTNAVDFVYETYDVHKASELEYLYNEYLKVSRERDQYERANADLDYYNRVLIRQLSSYSLYDSSIWIYQAQALVDPKEMVEVRHSLLEHRQKVRERIDKQIADIRAEYGKIQEIIKNHPEYESEVKDILDGVDQLCQLY